MKQWIQSWNLMRLLRLAMAIAIIYQGIDLQQRLFVGIGVLLALMPLFNIGCCGTNGCSVPRNQSKNNRETTFTEIK